MFRVSGVVDVKQAKSELMWICREGNALRENGTVIVSRAQKLTDLSRGTIERILAERGEPTEQETDRRLFEAKKSLSRDKAGYDKMTPEQKRQRIAGAIGIMSDLAIDRVYPAIMMALRQDITDEFGDGELPVPLEPSPNGAPDSSSAAGQLLTDAAGERDKPGQAGSGHQSA